MFKHMLALQETAFRALQPGKTCADIDKEVRAYYQKHELTPYWKHHVGHAIGIRYHEGPFLDLGDTTEIKPGMVFTIENGIEILTYYPRELASLTLPV
jgi:Xaa-Pro dipeptidase